MRGFRWHPARMLLTQDGVHALADFTIHAAPEYDEDVKRAEGNGGIMLTCHHRDEENWRRQWAGHVAAPTLRDLVLVAGQHWEREHRPPEAESAKAGAAK